MKPLFPLFFATLAGFAVPSFASEAEFLKSISGFYSGGGTVRLRTNSPPIKVKCSFYSAHGSGALTLTGTCRGLLVVSRTVSADIRVDGAKYGGSYIGAGSGTARLAGSRSGDRLRFAIRWAKVINGEAGNEDERRPAFCQQRCWWVDQLSIQVDI
ncbi:hypothetical protein [Pararhizobium sp. DWP3-4]|uniref:hypothetical protein n=1 Tax=Pararhizobium sp. DWP3-4 TaxID=2804565 RepID=UPI003CF6F3A3